MDVAASEIWRTVGDDGPYKGCVAYTNIQPPICRAQYNNKRIMSTNFKKTKRHRYRSIDAPLNIERELIEDEINVIFKLVKNYSQPPEMFRTWLVTYLDSSEARYRAM